MGSLAHPWGSKGSPAGHPGNMQAKGKQAAGRKRRIPGIFRCTSMKLKASQSYQEGKQELYQRLLEGEQSAVSAISAQWLKKIAGIAGAYASGQALVEDLVQEGNMGLLLGLEELLGAGEKYQGLAGDSNAMEQKLEGYVREAMGQYRQEAEGMANGEHTILAKVNLVHEARKALAEENGTIPALQELSDYTRIPMEEVRDIMALSQKKEEA